MYPQLIAAASRLAPLLSRLGGRVGSFGAGPGLAMRAQGISVPDVSASPVSAQPAPPGPSVPISLSNYTPPSPQPSVVQPTQPMPPVQGLDLIMPQGSVPLPRPRPAAQLASSSPVPLPAARPTDAPAQQGPEMSFLQRNTAMMRDPSSGDFIDPTAASQAVRGPDLIAKMLQVLHSRANA